jgi:hypothetical protein
MALAMFCVHAHYNPAQVTVDRPPLYDPNAVLVWNSESKQREFVELPSLIGCSLGADRQEPMDFMDRMDPYPAKIWIL